MRVAPVTLRCRTIDEALAPSDRVTAITHDYTEGLNRTRSATEAIALRGDSTVRGYRKVRIRKRSKRSQHQC